MPAIRTILHPTGLCNVDVAALRLAGSLARTHGARLVVLHVMKPWYVHGRARMLGAFLRQKMERWEALNRVRVAELDFPVEHRLTEGEPVAAILRAAEELPCDLIVMGTHGRSGLTRLLKGSTAEAVVRKAPCPVLTVGASPGGRLPSPDTCHEAPFGTEVRTAIDKMPAGRVRRTAEERAPDTGNGRPTRHAGPTVQHPVGPWRGPALSG